MNNYSLTIMDKNKENIVLFDSAESPDALDDVLDSFLKEHGLTTFGGEGYDIGVGLNDEFLFVADSIGDMDGNIHYFYRLGIN